MKDHIRVITAISSEINPASPAGKTAHYPPSPLSLSAHLAGQALPLSCDHEPLRESKNLRPVSPPSAVATSSPTHAEFWR